MADQHKKRGIVREIGFALLESLLPFVAVRILLRKYRRPNDQEFDELVTKYRNLLSSAPYAAEFVTEITSADFDRAAGLQSIAVTLLQAVAIVTAILAGIQIATWGVMTSFEHACMLVSDGYALIAFFDLINVSRPKPTYFLTSARFVSFMETEHKGESAADQFKLDVAAQRLASVVGNIRSRWMVANIGEASLETVRNSTLAALVAAIPYLASKLLLAATACLYGILWLLGK